MKTNCFTNRELSWLQFNERVLNEAGNARVPLAERLSFAAIYQSNLDEFFMVRVGTLMVQMHSDEEIRENKTNMTSEEQIHAILKRVKILEKKKALIYEQLMGELEPKGIRIINFNRLSNEEGMLLEAYFDSNIAPFLSPMIVGKQQPFPFLHNKHLYALVSLTNKNGKNKIGIVPCTNTVFKRLIEIPSRPGTFMLGEELILHFVSKLYPKYQVQEKSIMRLTRNADIDEHEVYDEDMDYRDIMEKLLKQRNRMSAVRLELSRPIDKKIRKALSKYVDIDKKHIIQVETPLDLSFGFQLQNYLHDKAELFYEKRSPRMTPALNRKESILDQVARKDVLLSYPFESMRPFLRMLHEAAEDDSVVSIKMTLYRVAERSKIIDALIEAAENGKEVVVLVELRARFDEANNIGMSRRLEEAGCHVIYGLGKYKVHSKLCLITRHTEKGLEYITQIGTGNYNEKTSRLYTDLSLMTGNQSIGADAAKVFQALLQEETVEYSEHLLVAPHCLQNRVLEMIDEQIALAKRGEEAYIGVKINSLTDKKIIDALMAASQAGVKIEMVVRGICCLIPGVPGKTENIRIVSIVGRFLEHSRIYIFGTGKQRKIYIASADFMTRNTLRRVEVAAPIRDEALQEEILSAFDVMLRDNCQAWNLCSDGVYRRNRNDQPKLNAQETFFQQAYDREQKAAAKK